MSVLIKGLKIEAREDGFGGKGLVIIGYDDKLYAVAHEQIIPLPDHGDLVDRDAMRKDWKFSDSCNRCERDAYRCQYYEEMSTMDVCGMLDDAPVVIPAERSEDG